MGLATWGIDQVDLMTLPIKRYRSSLDRDASLLLHFHKIHHGVAGVDIWEQRKRGVIIISFITPSSTTAA